MRGGESFKDQARKWTGQLQRRFDKVFTYGGTSEMLSEYFISITVDETCNGPLTVAPLGGLL